MRLRVALHVCESVVIWILHKERIHTKPALPYGPHKTFNVHVENRTLHGYNTMHFLCNQRSQSKEPTCNTVYHVTLKASVCIFDFLGLFALLCFACT